MNKSIQIVIGILLGIIVGGGVFFAIDAYNEARKEREQAAIERERRRQAHADSLRQIREAQEARERESEREERQFHGIANELKSFYLDSVLVDRPTAEHARYGVAGSSKEDVKRMRDRLTVTHDSGDWYRVRLAGTHGSLFRYVKVKVENKELIIDEVR